MPRKKTKITASSRELAQKMFESRHKNRVIKKIRLISKVWEITHTPRQ